MSTRACFGSLVALAVLRLAAPAAASTIAYQVPAGTPGTQNFSGELGMEFNVLWPVTVTELGVFDDGSDGLYRNLTAHLWDRTSTGTPLASLSFTPGDPGALVDGSRFKTLGSPLALTAGFRGTISASGYGGSVAGVDLEWNGNSSGFPPAWSTDSGGGVLSFVGSSRWGNAPGVYPPTADTGPANRYASGTFVFDAVIPPGVSVSNGSFETPELGDGGFTPSAPSWAIQLRSESNVLAELASTDPGAFDPAAGTFVGNTLEWDSTDSPFIGSLLSVALIKIGGAGDPQAAFDNVRISAADIPGQRKRDLVYFVRSTLRAVPAK